MQCRRKNRILSLRDEGGNWYYEQKEIIPLITNFFRKLFTTSQDLSYLKHTPMSYYGTLDSTDQSDLSLEPTIQEIKQAFFSFKPYKAPGPDGLHPFFYQNFWNETKSSLIDFCKETVRSKKMVEEMSKIYICLIPKCQNAKTIK